ncbi:hypothetical protein [Streptococcus ruminantium]|nr:hypothetical protein [Streptococcus ruminantium]
MIKAIEKTNGYGCKTKKYSRYAETIRINSKIGNKILIALAKSYQSTSLFIGPEQVKFGSESYKVEGECDKFHFPEAVVTITLL